MGPLEQAGRGEGGGRALRLIVADDEALARRRVTQVIRGRADVHVVGECASGPSTVAAVREHEPDLLLLDVQMPGLTGFEVLAQLEPDERPLVVFSTAFDEYALAAFEVHALDYLLKPYSDDRLMEALDRAREAHRTQRAEELHDRVRRLLDEVLRGGGAAASGPGGRARGGARAGGDEPAAGRWLRRLAVPVRDGVAVVDTTDVDWIEAAGDYAKVHVREGRPHLVRTTLTALERRLHPAHFARIHRSAIVRLDRVRHLRGDDHGDYTVTLTSGVEIRVGRTWRDALLERVGLRL